MDVGKSYQSNSRSKPFPSFPPPPTRNQDHTTSFISDQCNVIVAWMLQLSQDYPKHESKQHSLLFYISIHWHAQTILFYAAPEQVHLLSIGSNTAFLGIHLFHKNRKKYGVSSYSLLKRRSVMRCILLSVPPSKAS